VASSEEINKAFNKAVELVNAHHEPFPADVLLNLYAYYKKATDASHSAGESRESLITAFKTNALFQTKNMSKDEAKELYVETTTRYFLYRK
jgi:acyl-CoA-binding protein